MKLIFNISIVILSLLLVLLFSFFNAGYVSIYYVWGTTSLPLCVVVLLGWLLGVLSGYIYLFINCFSWFFENKHLRRKIVKLEKELSNIRLSPVEDLK